MASGQQRLICIMDPCRPFTIYCYPKNDRASRKAENIGPDEFVVGSREFDPVKVGLKSSGYEGFIFKTEPIKDDVGELHRRKQQRRA